MRRRPDACVYDVPKRSARMGGAGVWAWAVALQSASLVESLSIYHLNWSPMGTYLCSGSWPAMVVEMTQNRRLDSEGRSCAYVGPRCLFAAIRPLIYGGPSGTFKLSIAGRVSTRLFSIWTIYIHRSFLFVFFSSRCFVPSWFARPLFVTFYF